MSEPRKHDAEQPTARAGEQQVEELTFPALTPEQQAKVKGGIGGVGEPPPPGKLATN